MISDVEHLFICHWPYVAQVTISKWVDEKAVVHLYSGIVLTLGCKKEGSLNHLTAWMDLKSIMLKKISQSEKDKYHMIHLYVESNE